MSGNLLNSVKRVVRWVLKMWAPLLVIFGLFSLSFALLVGKPAPEERARLVEIPIVRVVEANAEDRSIVVEAQGTVSALREIEFVPEVAGKVIDVAQNFVSGGFFVTGEVLIKIDPRDAELRFEQAKAAATQLEARLAFQRRQVGRLEKLVGNASAPEQRLDDEKTTLRTLEFDVRQARLDRDNAALQLARTEVRAPFNGRVRTESVDIGQYVTPGQSMGRIYSTDIAEVRLPITDRQLGLLDLPLGQAMIEGPSVKITGRLAGRERSWQGRIVRVEGAVDTSSRVFFVVAHVDDPYGRKLSETMIAEGKDPRFVEDSEFPLTVGLFVTAEIEGRRFEKVFSLPRTALRDGNSVFLVDDGRLISRPVEVLRDAPEEVVVSGDLNDGMLVVTSPLSNPVPGMRVQPADDPEREPVSKLPSLTTPQASSVGAPG